MQQKIQEISHSFQRQRKQHVINICKQIKYIVQGNLKQYNIPKTVKQEIIPLLIEIFIENYQNSSRQTTTAFIINEKLKNEEQVSIFRNKINTFFQHDNKQNLKISSIKTNPNQFDKQNQTFNSSKFNKQLQKKLSGFSLSLKTFLFFHNKTQNNIRDSLSELKSYGDKRSKLIDNLFQIKKKIINKLFFQKLIQNKHQYQNNIEKNKLRRGFIQDFCKKLTKLVKIKLHFIFSEFKQNCLAQNKWGSIWIKKSALSSPICLQVSFWRMKNFFQAQNLKTQNKKQGCIKIIKSIVDRQKISFQKIKQFITINKQSQQQSSDQSLSSRQFEEMFENQEKSQNQLFQNKQNHQTKLDKKLEQNKQKISQCNNQYSNDDSESYQYQNYLEPIIEEDTEKTIKSTTSQKALLL